MMFKLSKPLKHGETEITELDLREPTVEDVGDLGYPFLMIAQDTGAAIQLQPKTILKYAARLSGIPPSSFKALSLKDLSELQGVIMGFFGDAQEAPMT
jgi:hypothetical protein